VVRQSEVGSTKTGKNKGDHEKMEAKKENEKGGDEER
jgi:hypothetical protein